ncbi:carbohydrate ABC transporter permease [Promineifilum sp.]|uniref:carbohydrate ABC transporter permease n=1 Tax=Promineifilum sp. TaxID=2664178 RepID=UPI0035B09D36
MAATTTAAEQVGQRRFHSRTGNTLVPYLFIGPHLIFFLVFVAYPFFYGLFTSFFRFDFLRPEAREFVLFDNYVKLFTPGSIQFPVFWNALGNTLEFVLYSVPPLVIIPLLLAVLLNTSVPGRNFFRGLYFAPWVLSAAVVGLLGFWIFQSQGGLVNYYLAQLGIPQPRWLSTMPWAWVSIVLITIWWTVGFNMIILLAALQDIPRHLYESASIDGATNWRQFISITLPILRPVLVFVIIITIIASFNLFAQPFFMTGGGPAQATGGGSTEPVMLRIYREGFERNQLGMAAAMSFIVATIMILFSYTNFRLFRTRE